MQQLHYNLYMPRIQPFDSCQINVNFRDHPPPHFHVIANDGREWLVRIDNCEVLEGPRDVRVIRVAMEWAAIPKNRDLLMQRFLEYRK